MIIIIIIIIIIITPGFKSFPVFHLPDKLRVDANLRWIFFLKCSAVFALLHVILN